MDAGAEVDKQVRRALETLRAGDRSAAQAMMQETMSALGAVPEPYVPVAEGLAAMEDRAGLLTVLARLEALPRKAASLLARGRILRIMGETPEEAVKLLEEAAELNPERVDVFIALTNALMEAGDNAGALAAGRRGMKRHPKKPLLWLNTLRAQAAVDSAGIDLSELDALVAAAPKRPAVHRLRLNVLRRRREISRAHVAVDAFAEACPGALDAVFEHAALALLEDDAGTARSLLAGELSAENPDLDRLRLLGNACNAREDEAGILAVLECLERMPPTADRLALSGKLFLFAHDHEAAIDALMRSLEADAEQPALVALYMEELTRLGRGADAIRHFENAPEPVQRSGDVLVGFLNAHWAVGTPETGIDRVFAMGQAQNPTLLRKLTEFLARLDRGRDAAENLETWLPASPQERATKLIAEAEICHCGYDFAGLQQKAAAVLKIDPNRAMALSLLGQARLALFNPDGAMAAQRQLGRHVRGEGRASVRVRDLMLWAKAEEMQLDPVSTRRLAESCIRGPQALGDVARKIILTEIDQTGPALALMLAMRLGGAFQLRPPGPNRIPKKLHQYWEGDPPPPDLQRAMDRMRQVNSECTYTLYSFAEARAYIAEKADAATLRAFRLARHAAERADIFRLVVLLHDGGIYVDVDDLCRRPLNDIIPQDADLMVYQEKYGAIANDIIASAPGNPVLRRALSSAVEETLAASQVSIWLRTGPGVMTRAMAHVLTFDHDGRLPPEWAVLRHSQITAALITGAPFSYKVDSRHWINWSKGTKS